MSPTTVGDAHHWPASAEVDIEKTPNGARLEDIAGCLRGFGEPQAIPRTIDEMNAAIGSEIADRRDRGRY
jgi:hypothetical protein